MSHPAYARVPDTDAPGSTAFRSLSRRESESNLVPRTPHSRTGDQTHFGLGDSEMNNDSFESYELTRQSQTAPLLASSASATFGDRLADAESRTRPAVARRRRSGILNQIPLVIGGILSVFLCLLIFISIQWPDTLQEWLKTSDEMPNSGVAPAVGNNTASENAGSKTHNHTTILDYSAYTSFPLSPKEYLAECWKQQTNHYHGGYWAKPPGGAADVPHPTSDSKTCSTTITFMFDGNRGLMADLALIAQLAGLAREQNRTFLIDDRLWNRGNWTTHFQDIRKTQPGPEPDCLPPPPEELVACPRTARHWIVTPRTAKFHFGHDFSEEFQDPYAYSTARLKPIFTRAFDSLESFIILSNKNIQLVRQARSELRRRIQANTGSAAVANYVSVHVRRGDRKAMSWEFIKPGSDGYVPLSNYVEAAQSTWSNFGPPGKAHVYVASDDPVSLDKFTKLSDTHVYSLRQWGIDGGRAREGSVTEAAEELAELASPSAYVQSEWMNRTEEQRIRLTRGMIVEMALLSELWDGDMNEEDDGLELVATVCTLTSNICKLAAIGLGWPNALEPDVKAWVEIDNRNNIEPEWEAFEII